MPQALIKISFRQVIDATVEGNFEKNILNTSYEEFKIKSQAYNREGKFKTFGEMKGNDGRANSLHYKCGFAVGGIIDKLNKQIPSLLDATGTAIAFDVPRFEVIESDIMEISFHKVAIHYITATLTLLDNFSNNLLLAYGDKSSILKENNKIIDETFILKLAPAVSVTSYSAI